MSNLTPYERVVNDLCAKIDALQAELAEIKEQRDAAKQSRTSYNRMLVTQLDKTTAELAEARALLKDAQKWVDPKLVEQAADEFDTLRTDLAQTRALLAVRTRALDSIVDAGILRNVGYPEAKLALASDGAEELSAIKFAIYELGEQSCDCEEANHVTGRMWPYKCGRCDALNALKKYFGESE